MLPDVSTRIPSEIGKRAFSRKNTIGKRVPAESAMKSDCLRFRMGLPAWFMTAVLILKDPGLPATSLGAVNTGGGGIAVVEYLVLSVEQPVIMKNDNTINLL